MDSCTGVLDDLLSAPCSARTKGIFKGLDGGPGVFWDDLGVVAGYLRNVQLHCIEIDRAHFVKGTGFVFDELAPMCIEIPQVSERALPFCCGDAILCCGKLELCSEGVWRTTPDATVMKMPIFDAAEAWDTIHFFAGAFEGWTQGLSWLPSVVPSFRVGRQIHVDHDDEVALVWNKKYRKPCLQGPLAPCTSVDPAMHTTIHTHIFDHSIFHVCTPVANLCYTASPPCPTWSRSGKSAGIDDAQGWAFVDLIRMCVAGQPLMIAIECVDELVNHRHFVILQQLFENAGFDCTWQDVVPYHMLAHVHRTRWLGIWMRKDVFRRAARSFQPLRIERIVPWSAQHYKFDLPRVLQEQLCLSLSEEKVYGDPKLLPPAKQRKLPKNASCRDVLNARVQDPFVALPTLCASYGQQHELPLSHLERQGIFANLVSTGPSFAFVDPFTHVALLGAVDNVVLPLKAGVAFRQVGNAIAVPHALLTSAIGFHTLLAWDLDVNLLVRKCWDERLTSFAAFIVCDGGFMILCSMKQFIRDFHVVAALQPLEVDCVRVELCHRRSGDVRTIFLPCAWKVSRLGSIFQWTFDVSCQVFAHHEDFRNLQSFSLRECAQIVRQCHICVHGMPFLDVCLTLHTCCQESLLPQSAVVISISPTLSLGVPLSQPGRAVDPCPAQFDDIVCASAFRSALDVTEKCLRIAGGQPAIIALADPPSSFSAVVPCINRESTIPEDSHRSLKRLRLTPATQFDASACAFFLPPCEDCCTNPWFAFKRSNGGLGVAAIDQQPVHSDLLILKDNTFKISTCNGQAWTLDSNIGHGDFVCLAFQGPVRAAGHHSAGPQVLAPGASFETRCEFAVNTSGWLAEDEMNFWTQHVQWTAPGFAFFAPTVTWDPDVADFVFPAQDEFAVPNNKLTIIPILYGSHWAAVEVNRASHLVTVVILGFPGPFHPGVLAAVARLLDFHPNRLASSAVVLPPYAHMCGWLLLDRWIRAASLQDDLPPPNDGFEQVSIEKRGLIEEVLIAAIED